MLGEIDTMVSLVALVCCIFPMFCGLWSQQYVGWTLTGKSRKGHQYARNGEDFVLTCKVTEKPTLILWYRNGTLVSSIMTGSCQNEKSAKERYIYTCNGSLLFSLTIPGEIITQVEQGAIWFCSNPAGLKSQNFSLSKIVPVQNVSISPNSDINIDVGGTINLLCATGACRPAAKITWHVGNKTMEGKDMCISEGSNKYITRSNLSLQTQIEHNGKDIYCNASNSEEDKVYSNKIRINVNYPPSGMPYIEDFAESATLNENQNVTFTCILLGGNPLANLTWNCFSFKGNIKTRKEEAISKITFISNTSMNGQLCTCIASHRVSGYEEIVQLNISIRSTKTFVIGDVSHPLIVYENEPIMLQCKGNDSISTDRFWNKTTNDKIIDENKINFQPITCFDTGNYSCQSCDVNGSTESASLEVYVNCKPRLLNRFSEIAEFVEGEKLTISLEFISYPYPNITWIFLQNETKESITLENNENGYRILENRTLYAYTLQVMKNKICYEDFGEYELLLVNEIGNESTIFTVNKKAEKTELREQFTVPTSRQSNSNDGTILVICSVVLIILVFATIFGITKLRLKKKKQSKLGNENERREVETANATLQMQNYDGSYRDNILYVPCGPDFILPENADKTLDNFRKTESKFKETTENPRNKAEDNWNISNTTSSNSKSNRLDERKPYPYPRKKKHLQAVNEGSKNGNVTTRNEDEQRKDYKVVADIHYDTVDGVNSEPAPEAPPRNYDIDIVL